MKKIYLALTLTIATQVVNAQSIDKFHQKYYAQLCQSIIECADNVGIAENLMLTKITSKENCIGFFTQRDTLAKWQKPIAAKTAVFHPKKVKSCLSALSKTSCNSISGNVIRPSFIEGCEAVITGTIKDFQDCDSHFSCQTSNASCYGNCKTPQLHCGDNICIQGQYCSQNNTCESLKQVGKSCVNFSECKNNNCVDGQCKAPSPVLKKGAACGGENSNICSIGEFCNDKNCVPFKKEGEICSTNWEDYKECETPFSCIDDICTEPLQ